MSQPCSLWSLHHLFLNFQYIFSSSSRSCKELAAKLKQEGNSPADKELILALAAVECGAPACSTASRAAPVFRCQRSSANAFCITTRARSQDGRLGHEAKMAKLRWPKGGVDALAKWLQAHPGHLPHLGLWIHRTFAKAATSLESLVAPSDLLRLNWGQRGYFLSYWGIVATDLIGWLAECVSPIMLFLTSSFTLALVHIQGYVLVHSLPLPALASSEGCLINACISFILKTICMLQSSLPVSWEMDSHSPNDSEAAKLLWNHTSEAQKLVLPRCPVGRDAEGSSFYLSG